MAEYQQTQHRQHEFLPLCDVLFNVISLASYFCDVVFDLIMAYAFTYYPFAPTSLFLLSLILVTSSLLITQIVSIRWYLWGARGKFKNDIVSNSNRTDNLGNNISCDNNKINKTANWKIGCVLLFHITQTGVLWRYFKLFLPVNLRYVKNEVRELCLLRLIHAFCEAAPMLLLQIYFLVVYLKPEDQIKADSSLLLDSKFSSFSSERLTELTKVSAVLSLWSICWAVASFSKGAARLRNIERLVLTWLGVLSQLFWRLGTVGARIGALIVYSSVYGSLWMIIVMVLHWITVLTFLLLTPDGLFHSGENLSSIRKSYIASLLAFIYIFSYINLHETNHLQKMIIFYSVMFLENALLVGVWAVSVNKDSKDFSLANQHYKPLTVIYTLLALFFGGMCFMGLYYRYFHVRRLTYEDGGRCTANLSHQNDLQEKNFNCKDNKNAMGMKKVKLNNGGIPGVFNCRFANPASTNLKRKKKKPTTFVPPPPNGNIIPLSALENNKWVNNGSSNFNGPQAIPFWKRPLSIASLNNEEDLLKEKNEFDMNNASSLNINLIHEKLKEKKQQQLRELQAIQEEIKEGKIISPASAASFPSKKSISNQQPPPILKQHTTMENNQNVDYVASEWPPVKMQSMMPPPPFLSYYQTYVNLYPPQVLKKPSNNDVNNSEISLTPQNLPCHNYSNWTPAMAANNRLYSNQKLVEESLNKGRPEEEDLSDLDGSQISLPRSYSLHQRLKYTNTNDDRESSRHNSSRFYLPSTNSSDGDVDSADNEDDTQSKFHQRLKSKTRLPSTNENVQKSRANKNFTCSKDDFESPFNVNFRTSYPSNTNALRSNQLIKSRNSKHETKL